MARARCRSVVGLPFVFFVLSMRSFFPFPAEPAVFHALSLGRSLGLVEAYRVSRVEALRL